MQCQRQRYCSCLTLISILWDIVACYLVSNLYDIDCSSQTVLLWDNIAFYDVCEGTQISCYKLCVSAYLQN